MLSSRKDHRFLFIAAILVAATAAVYLQVYTHGFVRWDDTVYVTENPMVRRGVSFEGIRWAFTTFHASNYHPLTWISHMVDVELFGLEPGGHHLSSVFFHIGNTLVLFLLLARTTGAVCRSGLVAALFALHPLHVESVAWVAERKDVLCTFFFFLTLLAYHRYTVRRGRGPYLLTLGLFCLALLAKPMAVTLPFVLLLVDYWPLGRLRLQGRPPAGRGGSSPAVRPLWSVIGEKVPFLLLSAASCLVTLAAQQSGGAVQPLERIPLTLRLGNSSVSYCKYLLKTVWPLDLAVFYPHPGTEGLPPWQVVLAGLALLLLTGAALKAGGRRPYLAMGWLWFLGTLVPVIGLVQVGAQAMADRYTYIPLVGVFIIVAWFGGELAQALRLHPLAQGALAVAAILGLGVACWGQVRWWQDSITLFEHSLQTTGDNSTILNNLGNVYRDQGSLEEAISCYRRALAIKPNSARVHNNLGVALALKGDLQGALAEQRRALELHPDYPEAHVNLGVTLLRLGRVQEAGRHFSQALKLEPQSAQANAGLGTAMILMGRLDEAARLLRQALKIDPYQVDALFNLGVAYMQQRQFDQAITHLRRVLELKPDYVDARINLGKAYAAQGRLYEAALELNAALRLNPKSAEAHNQLGIVLARQGRFHQAYEHFTKAVELKPDYEGARDNLRKLVGILRRLQEP